MKVVVAEKPSMGKDIARVLGATKPGNGYMEGNGYWVTWGFGHLVEIQIPEIDGKKWSEVPLPVLNPVTLVPKADEGARRQLKVISGLFDKADEVICAGDAGREGEVIFRYIYRYLKCQKPFRRLWINSLTDAAIRDGFASLRPGTDYDGLFDAGRARGEADFYMGVNGTRALTLAIGNGEVFSLGRVQSPTLAIICRRFLENKNFVPQPFWAIRVKTEKDGIGFVAKPKDTYKDKAQAEADLRRVQAEKTLTVTAVEKKERSENPPLLFDLTALQKEASKRLNLSADDTLKIAQSLYETHKVLSYPRTGSCYIPDDVFANVPALMAKCKAWNISGINAAYFDGKNPLSRGSVNAAKVTDHHALLPTGQQPDFERLTKTEMAVFKLVVGRTFEAFAPRCVKDETRVALAAGAMVLLAKGSVIRSAGWRGVLSAKPAPEDEENAEKEDENAALPALVQGEALPNLGAELNEDKTKPQPLLTEATLLSYMETAGKDVDDEEARQAMKECGLGTPATRAGIIETVLARRYVERDGKRLKPTEKGLAVYNIIKDKEYGSPTLTGEWERKMNRIAECRYSYAEFMREFRAKVPDFVRELQSVSLSVKSAREAQSEKMPVCPKCKKSKLRAWEKSWACTRECGFVLWREVCGKKLTDAQLADLAVKGCTGEIKGFTSKGGKKFDAKLKLNADCTIAWEFAARKA